MPASKVLLSLVVLASTFSAGCVSVVSYLTSGVTGGLAQAIMDSPDLAMVRDGAPAYLILIDGLLVQNPENVALLAQASQLNSAYAAAFVDDPDRSRYLQQKSLTHAELAVCLAIKNGCELRTRNYRDYERWLEKVRRSDVELLYQLGSVWAGWIQANSEDFAAIAELGRVKVLMARIAELDPTTNYGGPDLYLGVFETLLPPALGGRPEVGRRHFERSLEISEEKYLMTKVMFADQYARLLFDRDLHDRLLTEVVTADPQVPGLTLINTVAQLRAQELLDTADAYF